MVKEIVFTQLRTDQIHINEIDRATKGIVLCSDSNNYISGYIRYNVDTGNFEFCDDIINISTEYWDEDLETLIDKLKKLGMTYFKFLEFDGEC